MRPYIFPVALGLSITLHFVAAGASRPQDAPVLEGGAVSGVVALGLGFNDLVKSSSGAQAVTPDVPQQAVPTQTAAAQSQATTQSSNAAPAMAAVQPQSITQSSNAASTAAPVSPTQMLQASAPEQKLAATEPLEVTEALPKPIPPTPRPARPARSAQPADQSRPKPPAAAATARAGNAVVNARRGQATGSTQGTQAEASAQAKPQNTARTVGNGALRSYQSAVMRKIARVPPRSAGARGTATVGITISASGAIARTAIVKSSGHAGIDKIALAQIRRAGPFAPTPTGKSMSMSVGFKSPG